VKAKPADADSWQMLAAIYRRQHDYAHARDAFTHLIQLKRMDADAWADYADVLASLNAGSLRGPPAQAIESALRLQPNHAKALWLKATLAYEEHRYGDALTVWRQLRAALPPDSSDVRIVDANIAEALQLSGQTAATPVSNPVVAVAASPAAGSSEVTGTVSIDSRLASRVPPGATLFIYAKDADSPGPPLAVLRQVAGTWPVAFRLDDTLAMIPSRRLSQSEHVIVEARISRSGQATPAAGDLYVTSAVLNRSQRQKLALVINHEVG
jgi:cytochrome c-type biogenesis protein CcmH